MLANSIELDLWDLVLSLGFIGMAIGLSTWQGLGIEKQLIFAAGRALFQLLMVGYILAFVFDFKNLWAVLLVVALMLTIAAIVTRNRISKKIKKLLPTVWLSLFASSAIALSYAIFLIIQPETWYEPQYSIPIAGMVLGNSMNGASLAGERLAKAIENNRQEIETHLSLGATPQQAVAIYRKEAIRIGSIPMLNQMMVVGIVSLPGMFTGQVLSGTPPLDAASYQILILFMLLCANLMTTSLVTRGIHRQFFNKNAQLVLP